MAGNDGNQVYEITLKDIKVSDENVRVSQRDKDLDELAASIRKHGLLQPVVLLGDLGDRRPYRLIVGQRRYLAHKKIGRKIIRATFAGKLDETQAMIRSLAENMHRTELNHADAAKAVTALFKHFNHDIGEVHRETGLSHRRIRQYVEIEEQASPQTKRKLKTGAVSPADAQRALRAAGGNAEKADLLLERMQQYTLVKPQKDRLVEYGEAHPRAGADTILEEALKPRVERSIMVRLTDETRGGLEKASTALSMDPEVIASQAIDEWLSAKGFIDG